MSWTGFRTERLENYNWNVLDHYVITKGHRDYELTELLKYWRFRMFLIPQVFGQIRLAHFLDVEKKNFSYRTPSTPAEPNKSRTTA